MLVNQSMLQNFDIIILTCEALDLEIIHDIVSYKAKQDLSWPLISSLDVFQIRHSNKLRSNYQNNEISLRTILNLAYIIKQYISQDSIFYQINSILNSENELQISTRTTQYSILKSFLRRFRFLFRKYLDKRAVGSSYYYDDNFLNQLALTNIYMLFVLTQSNGYDYFWSYLANSSYSSLSIVCIASETDKDKNQLFGLA